MKTVQYCIALIGLVAGAAALAQDEAKAPAFETIDVNGDGYISVAEAQESEDVAGVFAELDSDSDGQISAEEYGKVAEVH